MTKNILLLLLLTTSYSYTSTTDSIRFDIKLDSEMKELPKIDSEGKPVIEKKKSYFDKDTLKTAAVASGSTALTFFLIGCCVALQQHWTSR